MQPETSELTAFVAVTDHGSVSGAAKELDLPRATVSRRLARLEDRLGVRLMHRTTRRIRLTDSGEAFYGHAREVLDAVSAATAAVVRPDDRPRGLLRVSTPPMEDASFVEMVVDFVERYPEVRLELTSTTAHQDLIGDNIDVALRATTTLDPSLIARRLARSCAVAVASPDYLESAGVPGAASDLSAHRCLVGFARGERPMKRWPLVAGGAVPVQVAMASNSMPLLLAAAQRGRGIALLPDIFCQDDLDAGRLVRVLEGVVGAISEIALVYPERRLLKPAVRAFVDHAVEWVGSGRFGPGSTQSDPGRA